MEKNISYHVFIQSGSVYEPERLSGISHFLEHIISESDLYRRKILPFLDKYEVYEDLGTNEFYTSLSFSLLTKKQFVLLRNKINIFFEDFEISKEVIEREKNSIKEEIAYLELFPDFLVGREFRKLMFTDTPFEKPIIGSMKVVSSLFLEDVMNWHRMHYIKGRMLEIVYNENNDNLEILSLPEADSLKKIPIVKFTNKDKESILPLNLSSSVIRVGWGLSNLSLKERIILDIIAGILKGASSSFISTEFQKPGLVYKGTANVDHFRGGSFLLVDLISTRPEEVVDRLRKYIVNLSRGVVNEGVFNDAKMRERNLYKFSNLEKPLIIGEEYISTGDLILPEERLKIVEEVVVGDVIEIAWKIINSGSCCVIAK